MTYANTKHGKVSASSTAAVLVPSGYQFNAVAIRNESATVDVRLGASTVTATDGLLLKAGESITLLASANADGVWVAAATAADVSWMGL